MSAPLPAPADTARISLTPPAPTVRGRFLWYDLMTPDVDAATHFYSAVTGWTVTPFPAGEGMPPYLMWTAGTRPIGGLMALPPDEVAQGTPTHWMAYIGTPDVDATFADALASGGRALVAPSDIPTVGRFAVLADPYGARFAIFQPIDRGAGGAGAPGMPGVGDVSWHELTTPEPDAAFAFYARIFGWTETMSMDMGPAGIYRMYGQGGTTYGGIFNPGHSDVPLHWLQYVHVADLERSLDAVRAGGGAVLNGPMEVPGGDHVAQCRDPQGGLFALHEARGAAAPEAPAAGSASE